MLPDRPTDRSIHVPHPRREERNRRVVSSPLGTGLARAPLQPDRYRASPTPVWARRSERVEASISLPGVNNLTAVAAAFLFVFSSAQGSRKSLAENGESRPVQRVQPDLHEDVPTPCGARSTRARGSAPTACARPRPPRVRTANVAARGYLRPRYREARARGRGYGPVRDGHRSGGVSRR
jgi:hypothetical protein